MPITDLNRNSEIVKGEKKWVFTADVVSSRESRKTGHYIHSIKRRILFKTIVYESNRWLNLLRPACCNAPARGTGSAKERMESQKKTCDQLFNCIDLWGDSITYSQVGHHLRGYRQPEVHQPEVRRPNRHLKVLISSKSWNCEFHWKKFMHNQWKFQRHKKIK